MLSYFDVTDGIIIHYPQIMDLEQSTQNNQETSVTKWSRLSCYRWYGLKVSWLFSRPEMGKDLIIYLMYDLLLQYPVPSTPASIEIDHSQFSNAAPSLWNKIPSDFKNCSTTTHYEVSFVYWKLIYLKKLITRFNFRFKCFVNSAHLMSDVVFPLKAWGFGFGFFYFTSQWAVT